MYRLVTIPSKDRREAAEAAAPEFMRPNQLPWAAVVEGFLSPDECDAILEEYNDVEPYEFDGCRAVTRECPRPLNHVLESAVSCARALNEMYWDFSLDADPAAWLQTYEKGDSYALHTDAAPGQMRKLTAVVMLTDPGDYGGGSLWVKIEPREYIISKLRGTIVVFPSWVTHFVDEVKDGKRQTINLGFWGPNFR